MSVEIRNPSEEEFKEATRAVYTAFGDAMQDEDVERERKVMPLERFFTAFDNGKPVGAAGAYPFELTIPGGTVPCAGVTSVGVLPSHRRRGIMSDLMRRQLTAPGSGAEPLAYLSASESAIYGRFGYGIAVPNMKLDARTDRFRFRGNPEPVGAVRLVEPDEALELFPPVFNRVRVETPGMFARTPERWTAMKLADPESWRRGSGPKQLAVLELDGKPAGYAIYRVKSDWDDGGIPRGQVNIVELFGATPVATRELWRYVFSMDLIAKVHQSIFDRASPLFLMVMDARRLHLGLADGHWLRIVDAEAALAGRAYAADDTVVLELRDEFCSWNAGRWRVGAEVGRTKEDADLAIDVADLASVYLGAFDFHALARAERVEELKPGALERASALFRTTRPPYCPEEF